MAARVCGHLGRLAEELGERLHIRIIGKRFIVPAVYKQFLRPNLRREIYRAGLGYPRLEVFFQPRAFKKQRLVAGLDRRQDQPEVGPVADAREMQSSACRGPLASRDNPRRGEDR